MARALTLTSSTGQHDNYAGYAILGWAAVGAGGASYALIMQLSAPFTLTIGSAAFVAAARLTPGAWKELKRNDNLREQTVTTVNRAQLEKLVRKASVVEHANPVLRLLGLSKNRIAESIYLGSGYVWRPEHAIKSWEILSGVVDEPPQPADDRGKRWIQFLEEDRHHVGLPTKHTEGNVAIYGTTGAGKTWLYKLIIKQAILRGEPVICVDPKGDKGLKEIMKNAYEEMGIPERFVMVHPGFPDESVRINLLANFNKPSELAARVASLVPSAAQGDPFVQFITNVLTYIISGMLMVGERPTLRGISSYVHNGTADLLVRTIQAHADKHLDNWVEEAGPFITTKNGKPLTDEQKTDAYITFYRKRLIKARSSTEIEGLINMTQHEKSHFDKMIISLHPVLTFLTTGDVGSLLSPDVDDTDDERMITNLARVTEEGFGVFIGLDTLSDEKVGKSISNLLMADLAAFAGDRYNYGKNHAPVNFLGDEAGEIMTPALIRILNKARGAGVRTFLAAQTFSDYIVALGNKDQAHQVAGNVNTIISLRQHDPETQEEVLGNLPKVSMEQRGVAKSGKIEGSAARGGEGGLTEKYTATEIDRVAPSLLAELPNFEYFARFPSGEIVKGRIPLTF